MTRLLKPAEVAELLGVSKVTVQRWIARAEIPVVRVGGSTRVHPTDLAAWVDARRTPARKGA